MRVMRIFVPFVLVALSSSLGAQESAPSRPNLVRVQRIPTGGQIFQYKNGASCLRRDDYEKTVHACGKIAIKTVFEASGSYQTKIVNIKKLSPKWEMIDDAFFDICSQYGEGISSLAEYKENRKAYDQLRLDYLAGKIPEAKEPGSPSAGSGNESTDSGCAISTPSPSPKASGTATPTPSSKKGAGTATPTPESPKKITPSPSPSPSPQRS
jgi:hypothetical protein